MPNRRYARIVRVNELVREVVADELERLADPGLGFVTITGVDVAGDLRNAKVYYSVLGQGEEAAAAAAAALAAAATHLKATIGRQVRLRYTPNLEFREDPAVSQGQRIEQIIRELHAAGGDA